MKKSLLAVYIYVLIFSISSVLIADEPWIDYDDISKIELGSSKQDVVSFLGDPVLLLGNSEYDNTMYLFYNYHIKSFKKTNGSFEEGSRHIDKERTTLLKFTFVDDNLVSWEEDKMTLAMSTTNSGKKNNSFLSYFSLLLNLLLIIKII